MNVNDCKPKVSVIIPMYNCARFLPDFFRDMKEQSLKDFEMICVIDGATDNTLEIVKQYEAEDDRIRYFYKENGGAGTARNLGLDYARGEYVMWIDADDRYSPDLLKEMATAADEFMADEVLCLFDSYDYKINKMEAELGFDKEVFPENTCVNPFEALITKKSFSIAGNGATNKLYRKAFIKDNNLYYSATRIANDVKFIYSAIAIAKKVVGVHKKLIHVQKRINPDSITSNRGKHIQDISVVFSELFQWLKERNLSERLCNTFCVAFKYGIIYNSQFAVNREFIEAIVYTLNEKEPWTNMSSRDIAKLFGKWFDIGKIKKDIQKLEAVIRENKDDDTKALLNRFEMAKNRLDTMALIWVSSVVRYDRDFRINKISDYQKQISTLKRQVNTLKDQAQGEKNSWNYRVGSAILWLPKKIYYLFK